MCRSPCRVRLAIHPDSGSLGRKDVVVVHPFKVGPHCHIGAKAKARRGTTESLGLSLPPRAPKTLVLTSKVKGLKKE